MGELYGTDELHSKLRIQTNLELFIYFLEIENLFVTVVIINATKGVNK